ncbi:MAG: S10 family serine carboxypeptidase-like protein, partial [Flavisolibacter sp.]
MRLNYLLFVFCFITKSLYAQKTESNPTGVHAVITKSSVTIAGKRIDYTAHTGYLDLKNDTGKLLAKMFFTYYRKEGEESARRPVTFTFNGGPGSSSVWLHLGVVGPKRVLFDDEGNAPPPP